MTGFQLSSQQFEILLKSASRHHRKQLAGLLNLAAHTRRGDFIFSDSEGRDVPYDEVHRACNSDAEVQRQVYNLYMHYAHFGRG